MPDLIQNQPVAVNPATGFNQFMNAKKSKNEFQRVKRIFKKNGATYTLQAHRIEKTASITIARILEKIEADGWTRDQAEYLLLQAMFSVRIYRTLCSNWSETRRSLKRCRHGDEIL